MPISVPVVRAGNVVTPQFTPPDAIGVTVASNSYLFDTPDDFFSPDIAAHLGTNVRATPRVVPRKFAGMHYHALLPTVSYAVARNVDVPGCIWSAIERSARGSYEWSALDAFVRHAAARGCDIVFCFVGTPTWASARPGEPGHYGAGGNAEPRDVEAIGAFAAAVCARYRERGTPIAAFEIWNEPKFDGGGGVAEGNYFTGTPEAMARMARAIFQGVKAIDPKVLVLSPAPTGLEYPWVAGDGSGTDHLARFMAAPDGAGGTGRDWIDAIAFHSYSHNGENDVQALAQMVANARAVMALHGLDERAIWITETSAITPVLSSFVVQRQQEVIARTLLLALGCGVERIVWYAWDDPLGFHRQPAVASYWDELVALLAGSTVSLVNSLRNRRVAAVIDGTRYLV